MPKPISASHAAKELGVGEWIIRKWCIGSQNKKHKPRDGCWSEFKYER